VAAQALDDASRELDLTWRIQRVRLPAGDLAIVSPLDDQYEPFVVARAFDLARERRGRVAAVGQGEAWDAFVEFEVDRHPGVEVDRLPLSKALPRLMETAEEFCVVVTQLGHAELISDLAATGNDDARIVAGQGTVGLEILEQAPEVTTLYVPAGGGGLASGVAAAVKALRPDVKVIGVEPAGAPKMTRSLEAGHPVTIDQIGSIADGLLTLRPGDVTFAHVRSLVDEIVIVDDDEIADAVRVIARDAKLVAEPSGAATVAAARRMAPPDSQGTHVAVVSGGNVSLETLARILAG